MKKIILSLLMVFWMSTVQAQKGIELDPVIIHYSSPIVETTTNVEGLAFEVKEDYLHQFFSNPLRFIQENFDYAALNLQDYDDVEVEFINSKGSLRAFYNKKGELVKTFQRFEDIRMPHDICTEVYRNYKGWTMVSNRYTASGRFNEIDKELYKITLKKGKETKRIKIVPATRGLAAN